MMTVEEIQKTLWEIYYYMDDDDIDTAPMDTLASTINDIEKLGEENKRLKEELRKYQILQYTPNELEIKLNMLTVLKNGYNEYNEKHFGELCDNLLATTEGKSC